MFEPFIPEQVTSNLRALLTVSKLRIHRTGSYSDQRIMIGELYDQDNTSIIIVLNKTAPYIYLGKIKKKLFNIIEYKIEDSPAITFTGDVVRFETALPKFFVLKNDIGTILNNEPTVEFNQYIKNKWHPIVLSTKEISEKTFEGSWAWTYEIDLNRISGTNVIYCKNKSDSRI
jgi:hypothetical protein